MDTLMLALRVVLALGAVVGVLWFVQKRVNDHQKRGRTGDPLTVIARRGVGPKASVVVLDTGGKRFLLGVTEHAVNVLHADDAPGAEIVPAAAADPFAAALAQAGAATPDAVSAPALSPLRRVELDAPPGPSVLAGSILSPATWKQAGAALKKGLVR